MTDTKISNHGENDGEGARSLLSALPKGVLVDSQQVLGR